MSAATLEELQRGLTTRAETVLNSSNENLSILPPMDLMRFCNLRDITRGAIGRR